MKDIRTNTFTVQAGRQVTVYTIGGFVICGKVHDTRGADIVFTEWREVCKERTRRGTLVVNSQFIDGIAVATLKTFEPRQSLIVYTLGGFVFSGKEVDNFPDGNLVLIDFSEAHVDRVFHNCTLNISRENIVATGRGDM